MTLEQIKTAVKAGHTVNWCNSGYIVICDSRDNWLIYCTMNDTYIGLTWLDGVTLNGKPEQFYINPNIKPL